MKYFSVLLVILALVFIAMPVSATINATVLTGSTFRNVPFDSGTATGFDIDTRNLDAFGATLAFGGGGAGGRSGNKATIGLYTSAQYIISEQKITYASENAKLYFTMYRTDGQTLSGYILLTPDTEVSGTRTIRINEYDYTNTKSYVRSPLGIWVGASDIYVSAIIDECAGKEYQYFMMNPYLTGAPANSFKLDDSAITAIPAANIAKTPIYRATYTSESSTKPFQVIGYMSLVSDYYDSYTLMKCTDSSKGETGNWWDGIVKLVGYIVNPVGSAIEQLTTLGNNAATLLKLGNAIVAFVFAAEMFIGISAFYTAIAILLCIEDADDLFRAFGCFFRRERALFRFYMELFRAVKDIIKWW